MSSLKNVPFQPPPPGQVSNFNNPESRGPTAVAIMYTFISLMWSLFLMRLYNKVWILRSLWWDDGKSHPLID